MLVLSALVAVAVSVALLALRRRLERSDGSRRPSSSGTAPLMAALAVAPVRAPGFSRRASGEVLTMSDDEPRGRRSRRPETTQRRPETTQRRPAYRPSGPAGDGARQSRTTPPAERRQRGRRRRPAPARPPPSRCRGSSLYGITGAWAVTRGAQAYSEGLKRLRRRLHALRDADRGDVRRRAAPGRVRGPAGLRPAPAVTAVAPPRSGCRSCSSPAASRPGRSGPASAADCTPLLWVLFFFGLVYVTVVALVRVVQVTRAGRRGRIAPP